MELEIKINMDNAAFDHGKRAELTRILKAYINSTEGKFKDGDCKTLMDTNGNSVGYAKIIGR